MKPSIPKGTRDFSPLEMMRRNYIFDVIKNVYLRYGFEQIETPAMENLSTLEGKYGEEGDKLLFRILNSRVRRSSHFFLFTSKDTGCKLSNKIARLFRNPDERDSDIVLARVRREV